MFLAELTCQPFRSIAIINNDAFLHTGAQINVDEQQRRLFFILFCSVLLWAFLLLRLLFIFRFWRLWGYFLYLFFFFLLLLIWEIVRIADCWHTGTQVVFYFRDVVVFWEGFGGLGLELGMTHLHLIGFYVWLFYLDFRNIFILKVLPSVINHHLQQLSR